MDVITTIGRRKTSVARIHIKAGTGKISVNNKDFQTYFPILTHQNLALQPLKLLQAETSYDINANIDGGGITGQADALKLAIARALTEINAENKSVLKTHQLLTRDPRMVERKKFGQKKARKRFQFSKR
jgi:small subunit ribosomal protein S9